MTLYRSLLSLLVVILFVLTFGGCATAPGQFNGLGDDVMAMMVVYRTDDGALTKDEYVAVVDVAKRMGNRVGVQLSSPLEAGLSSGIVHAAGGALDAVGASYGVVGVVSGLSTYSYARVFVVAEATENALRDRERTGQSVFHMIHVTAAFVRSGNTSESFVSPLRQKR